MNQIPKKSGKKKAASDKKNYVRKYQHQFGKHWTNDEIEKLADEMFDWFKAKIGKGINKKPKNIWFKDFATEKMVGKQRLNEFTKKNEYFAFLYELCQTVQESYLFHIGVNMTKPTMAVFALKNVAGWRDNFDVGVNLPEEYLEALKKEAVRIMSNNL